MAQKEIEVILARQLSSYLALPAFIVDPDGGLVFYNDPAERVLGRRYSETGEMPMAEWATLFRPTDREGRLMRPEELPLVIAVQDRRPAHGSCYIEGLDGQRRLHRGDGVPPHRTGRPVPRRRRDLLGAAGVKVRIWGSRGSSAPSA